LDPLATHIQTISRSICIPSSNISIDEMIARFSGRSAHTVRIKNKPTPEGYKILSLCDAGYTYTFIFTSRIQNQPEVQQVSNLSKVGCEVYHLVSQLPRNKSFNIYMDNYFTSIKLFKYLRENNIGACGTVRKNSANFPQILKVDKKLDWDTLSGVVVDNVLAILWMDNGPVTMLSTIHQIDEDENRIERIRRRPRETSTNAAKVRAVFGNSSKKSLPIPIVIDDYNHFMGGVDIADQLRGYYGTQLPVRRTWMPLFFWLIDTAIINSYLVLKKSDKNISHKDFRMQLVWDLIKAGLEEKEKKPNTRSQVDELTNQFKFIQVDATKQQQYVTANFELPSERLLPDGHLPEWREARNSCIWCKYLIKKDQKETTKNPPQSQLYCIKCNVALCCNKSRSNCFKDYHTQVE
jgi:Transposase IS4